MIILITLVLIALVATGCIFFIWRYRKNRHKNDAKICPHCQKPIESDAVFCEHCGARVLTNSESTEETISEKEVSRKKTFKRIGILAGTLLGVIAASTFIFTLFHQWRWDSPYGSMNAYNVGAYSRRSTTQSGLFRYDFHWWFYEDLTDGYIFDDVQVTNYYIAAKERGIWTIYSPDFERTIAYSIDDVVPLVYDNHSNLCQEILAAYTGMVWVKKNGYWGTINVFGRETINYQYDDIYPIYQFENGVVGPTTIITCKKNGLWGKISISYSGIVNELLPHIFENKEIIDTIEMINELYTVNAINHATGFIPKKIYNNEIMLDSEGYNLSYGCKLDIIFVYGGYAFFKEGVWYCIPSSKLAKADKK